MKFLKQLLRSPKKKEKGIALVSTLFAIVIVFILGIGFLGVAMIESKTTRVEKEAVYALQMANSGAELVLNYLSIAGGGTEGSWEADGSIKARNPGVNLKDATLADIDSTKFNFRVDKQLVGTNPNEWRYTFYITPDRKLDRDNMYTGKSFITMKQKMFAAGQPYQFLMESVGEIYRTGDSTTVPLARRVVEVRFREKAALDYLNFTQNARAWDRAGLAEPPPEQGNGYSDSVVIDKNYTANGEFCVDGGSAHSTETAGNFRFKSTDNVNFYGSVDINQSGNAGLDQEDEGKVFKGELKKSQPSIGLPEYSSFMSKDLNQDGTISGSETGNAVTYAKDTSGGSYLKAYYRCGDNDGISGMSAGDIGHSACTNASVLAKWRDGDSLNGTGLGNDDMSKTVPADIEFDPNKSGDGTTNSHGSKPGFAKFTVEFLKDGKVKIYKTTAYTKRTVYLAGNESSGVSIDRFKNGTIYFEGGNVEVKNASNNGGVKGKLTIVSAEDPTREPIGYTGKLTSGTSFTQSEYDSNMGKVDGEVAWVKQLYSDKSIYKEYDNGSFPVKISPKTGGGYNYTGEHARAEGPWKINGKWVWPGDPNITNTYAKDKDGKGSFSGPEREGNITIGGDLTYTADGDNSLGLIAKNYLLLNAGNQSDGHTLNVNAVLMSFDHSLQFDDVDMSGKGLNFSTLLKNGKLNFMGSYIAQYADVEGKTDGTGYTNQTLVYDQNLKTTMPPNFPKWDIYRMNSGIVVEYMILNYTDKGAVQTM